MILILTEDGTEPVANAIAAALAGEYSLPSVPRIIPWTSVWAGPAEWDDLLLVLYKSTVLPAATAKYIADYRTAHPNGPVIPISGDPQYPIPPPPLNEIKAAPYDGTPARTARIVQSVGVFLGLALRNGSQKIFVAYRSKDGTKLAKAIYGRLEEEGFDAWCDEEDDNLTPGVKVQDVIRKRLEEAAMVVLVDTPLAPESKWIKVEIDTANAQLIPVVPVVWARDRTRFIQLDSLRREALVRTETVDDAEWEGIRKEMVDVLVSALRRRLKIVTRARKEFEARGYNWQEDDERRRMYLAGKAKPRITSISHCLVQDVTYTPALTAYCDYLVHRPDIGKFNFKFCIYDRDEPLGELQTEELSKPLPNLNVIFAHYNELNLLFDPEVGVLR